MGSKSKKQKKANKKSVKQGNKPGSAMFIIPICALLFFPAFFRGLFFEREFRVVHIAAFVLLVIWIVLNRKDNALPAVRFKYEYFLFAAVAVYFLTIPFAASRRLALSEALKYMNYLAVYILVRDQVLKDKKTVGIFSNTILASVFAMCMIGLFNYIGLMDTRGALVSGRVSSTLQYPNTLAAVIAASAFLNLYLVLTSESIKMKMVYTAVLNVLFTAFILTFSRTMYVIFPLLAAVFFAVVPNESRGGLLAALFAAAVPSLAAALLLIKYTDTNSIASIMILLISVLLSAAVLYAGRRVRRAFVITSLHKYIAVGLLVAAVIMGSVALTATRPLELSHYDTEDGNISRSKAVYSIEGEGDYLLRLDISAKGSEEAQWLGRVVINGLDRSYRSSRMENFYIDEETEGIVEIPFSTSPDTYYITVGFYNHYNNTSFTIKSAEVLDGVHGKSVANIRLDYRYIPRAMVSRVESLNLKARSFQGRVAFFRDGYTIIKDNPLFGLGGGAWQAAYLKYRSYEYWTTQTHSYPIQVWMEIGTIGLMLVLGFALFYIIGAVKAFLSTDTGSDRLQLAATAFFALCILAHSMLDFDLSLGAVSIMFWTSLAVTSVHFEGSKIQGNRLDACIKPVLAAALIVLLGVTAAMAAASNYNRRTAEAAATGQYQEAQTNARMAVRLDPLNSVHRRNLVSVADALAYTDAAQGYALVNEQLEAAIRHDPYNYELYSLMARHQNRYGNLDGALQFLDKAIMYNPVSPEGYLQKMNLLYNAAENCHRQEDRAGAASMLEQLIGVKEEMANRNSELLRPIEINPDFLYYYYKANYVLDNIDTRNVFNIANRIVMYEDFAFDSDSDLMPDLWQIPDQAGKTIEGYMDEKDETGMFVLVPDNPSFYIQRMNMDLDPSREYLLMIEGYSRSPEGEMRVMIRSGNGTAGQYDDGYFTFNQESSVYETTFETTGDIKAGSQYIRLYFRDIEDEVVLKRITLMRID